MNAGGAQIGDTRVLAAYVAGEAVYRSPALLSD
jgi:hypothetical protein